MLTTLPPQVERELGSVMLDQSFAAKLALSKGQQMLVPPPSPNTRVFDAAGVPEAKSENADIMMTPVQVLRQPEKPLMAHISHARPHSQTRTHKLDGVEEAKIEQGLLYPPPRGADFTPEPTAAAQKPLIFRDHESSCASQIKELQQALQDSMGTMHAMNSAMHETIHETNRSNQKRAESLEAKIEAFMVTMTEQLGAIERQVMVDRHEVDNEQPK